MLCYNDLDRSRQSETFAKFSPASALGVKRFQRASGIYGFMKVIDVPVDISSNIKLHTIFEK